VVSGLVGRATSHYQGALSMNDSRFDTFTRWAARPTTRRAALGSAGAALATLAVGRVAAQDVSPAAVQETSPMASPTPSTEVNLLFVQTGGATTLTPGSGDVHTLTITGVTAQTLNFSDRPYRIAGAIPTARFVDQWAATFADSPPNATLIGHPEAGGDTEEAVVVELLTPAYDPATATLTYQVRILDVEEIVNQVFEQEPLTVLDAPRQYAEAHLFIDDVGERVYCRQISPETVMECESICDGGGYLSPDLLEQCDPPIDPMPDLCSDPDADLTEEEREELCSG
jgi:hypothetical protein